MTTFIKNFVASEDGAVTVDWVVLTAAVVGLAIGAIALIRPAVDGLVSDIASAVSGVTIQ